MPAELQWALQRPLVAAQPKLELLCWLRRSRCGSQRLARIMLPCRAQNTSLGNCSSNWSANLAAGRAFTRCMTLSFSTPARDVHR